MTNPRRTTGPVSIFAAALIFAVFSVSCAGVPRGRTTALHTAVDEGDVGSLETLLSETQDIDARDEEGRTALHHASLAGDIVVTATLLNAGADPNLPDADGRTPLHYAVLTCRSDLVAMILAADADPMLFDDDEATALDLAVSSGCDDARLIIESSMDGFIPGGTESDS